MSSDPLNATTLVCALKQNANVKLMVWFTQIKTGTVLFFFFLLSLQFGIATTAASSVKWKEINLERNSELCSQSGKRLLAQRLPCHQWKVVLFFFFCFLVRSFLFSTGKKGRSRKKKICQSPKESSVAGKHHAAFVPACHSKREAEDARWQLADTCVGCWAPDLTDCVSDPGAEV